MATIQVDLVMLPERFDLTYIDENGQQQRPIAIHRAIYGSLERFIGILVEHFAGAFPLWLAPVQAVVIPIADRHIEAAEELAGVLRARGLRVEVDGSRQPDAEQDPARPGAEGPVHARPRRPRGRGADRVAADAGRRAAAGGSAGTPWPTGSPPRVGCRAAWTDADAIRRRRSPDLRPGVLSSRSDPGGRGICPCAAGRVEHRNCNRRG